MGSQVMTTGIGGNYIWKNKSLQDIVRNSNKKWLVPHFNTDANSLRFVLLNVLTLQLLVPKILDWKFSGLSESWFLVEREANGWYSGEAPDLYTFPNEKNVFVFYYRVRTIRKFPAWYQRPCCQPHCI